MEGRLEQTKAAYLDVLIECAEHVVDLVLEPTGQHLISLVQHKHLDVADVCQHNVYSCQSVSPESVQLSVCQQKVYSCQSVSTECIAVKCVTRNCTAVKVCQQSV